MKNYFIADALVNLHPNCQFAINADDYSTLRWLSKDIQMPTLEEINNKLQELESAHPLKLLRILRNQKIAETDWEIQRNIEMGIDNTELINYRISLRNLPQEIELGNIQPPTIDDNGNLVFNSWPER